MTPTLQNRLMMAALGCMAGLCFFALSKVFEHNLFSSRLALALGFFALTLFGGIISMACAVPFRRMVPMTALHGAIVAALVSLAALRFDPVDTFNGDPVSIFSVLLIGFLPLPFLMANYTAHWRDYPSVFTHAWGLFLRLSFAWLFTGLVWGLIFLSDALFDLVGLPIIDRILNIEISAWIITGLLFGLAMALADELSDYLSPYLILQVMRLLVPFVLLVLVVFLAALPFRGINDLFGDLSSAAILLTMAAAGVALVTAAADQADDAATSGGVMRRSAQGLALIVVVPAALGGWAIATRVWQYGWTPERLFAAWAAVFILAYALAYGASVLRGEWRAHVRQANIYLALAMIGSAALWLTPVLNPQAISAQSHLALFKAKGLNPDTLDFYALSSWGIAGKAVLAELETIAKDPGQQALAASLSQGNVAAPTHDLAALRTDLAKIMPLQPNTPAAIAARDRIFAAAEGYQLTEWQNSCAAALPAGQPGCAMVMADLRTDLAGDEVILAQRSFSQYFSIDALSITNGYIETHRLVTLDGQSPEFSQSVRILTTLQTAVPELVPSPFNMLKIDQTSLMISPQ